MPEQTAIAETSHHTITEADWAAAAAADPEAFADEPAPKAKKPKAVAALVEEPAEVEAEEPAEAVEDDDADDEKPDPNSKTVTTDERVRFRQEKRKAHEKLQAQIADAEAKFAAKEAELAGFAAAKRSAENGDFDGYAKAMGFVDWNDANARYLAESQGPGYKRLRALEKERDEARERESKQETARREEAERASRKQQYDTFVGGVAKSLETNGGLHAEFAKDPEFLDMVLQEKRKAFDEGDEDLSDADAADRALEFIATQHAKLLERFTKHADTHKAAARFKKGGRPTQTAETRDRERIPEKGKKPNVSHTRASEAGASSREKNDGELLKEFGFT